MLLKAFESSVNREGEGGWPVLVCTDFQVQNIFLELKQT